MKNLLSLLLIFSMLISHAQINETDKVNINWGAKIKMDKREFFIDVLSHDETGYCMFKSSKKGMIVERYNKKLNLENSIELPLDYKGKDMIYEGLTAFNDKLLLLSSFNNRKQNTNYLFYQTIDSKTLQTEGQLVNLGKITYEKKKFDGDFGYEISSDSSKFLLFFSQPYKKDAPEKYGFKVLDENMKELWDKEVELPYTEQFFSVKNYTISNKGDVFVLGKEFNEDKSSYKKGKGSPNYKYHIIGYFNQGNKVKDYEVQLENKFITDIAFAIQDNGNLICSGFYSENGSYSVKGTFFLSINGETKEIIDHTLKEFDEDFITQNWSEKAIQKAKKKEAKKNLAIEMFNYDLRNFILRDDGGAVLLAEQYYVHVSTHTYTDANGNVRTTTTYHYYYNDIIVININPNGDIEWATKIDKKQHSVNDGGRLSSYALQIKDDVIHLVYNESAKKYFDKEERKEMDKKDKNAYLTLLVSVDGKGEFSKEILFNNSEERTYIVPKLCKQISQEEMIIYAISKKEKKFGNMRLQ